MSENILHMSESSKKLMLIILDWRGIWADPQVSAIDQAKKPFYDSLIAKYPHATLVTHGESVGLPEGQMWNSEVWHMHIGAGRRIYQDLVKISKSFSNQTIYENPTFKETIEYAKANKKPIHLIGLLSDGGVHSHIDHIIGMSNACKNQWVEQVYIHACMDGRDTDPKSGIWFLQRALQDWSGKVASVIGRYYAMDRDNRWERIKEAYDLFVHGKGEETTDILQTMQARYDADQTDEFIKPIVCVENEKPVATIQDWDVVICMNFRSDRVREITKVLTQEELAGSDTTRELGMQPLQLHYLCMTPYDDTFQNLQVLFPKENVDQTLWEIISRAWKTQLHIAETEKYPHITFFFAWGEEELFEGEERILVPSPKVATYDLQPEMSAPVVTEKLLEYLWDKQPDMIILNFANADMVGHTGVFEAAVKAVEAVDASLAKIIPVVQQLGYEAILIADHGNADVMKNADGSVNTQHSTSPVPIVFVTQQEWVHLRDGALTDIAPTILARMGIQKPDVMTWESLVG